MLALVYNRSRKSRRGYIEPRNQLRQCKVAKADVAAAHTSEETLNMQSTLSAVPSLEQRRVREGRHARAMHAHQRPGMPAAASRRGIRDDAAELTTRSVQGDEYRYRIKLDGTVRIVRCVPASAHIEIPENVGGRIVTELGDSSFSDLPGIHDVACPPSIRRIGGWAFSGCLNLDRARLNEDLESIGEEAFARCWALKELHVPASVRTLGPRFVDPHGNRWRTVFTNVSISPENRYLMVDENDVVYERGERGLALVDGARFKGSVLKTLPNTVDIRPRALASNGHIKEALLNEGLITIGEAAFRGCTGLSHVRFPETLEEIGTGAFSCSALREAYLPAACTHLAPHALETGPIVAAAAGSTVSSTLASIRVHPENPAYRMESAVLCRRIAAGGSSAHASWEAVLCTNGAASVHLPRTVTQATASVFSGAAHIETLHVHEGLRFARAHAGTQTQSGTGAFLPHRSCERLVIDLDEPIDGTTVVDLEFPAGDIRKQTLCVPLEDGRVNVRALLQAYDAALPAVPHKLERAHAMAARLGAPVLLAEESRALFTETLNRNLSAICVHFGARSWWDGFDKLIDARVVNEANISSVIGLLSAADDALSVRYLLNAQWERFGKARWDFEI